MRQHITSMLLLVKNNVKHLKEASDNYFLRSIPFQLLYISIKKALFFPIGVRKHLLTTIGVVEIKPSCFFDIIPHSVIFSTE